MKKYLKCFQLETRMELEVMFHYENILEVTALVARKRVFLKKARKRRKWSQQQTAEFLNISRSYYAAIENGFRDPSLKLAVAISDLLDVPVKSLVNN
jgi:DNA-binding XRE family transcriptional regulator